VSNPLDAGQKQTPVEGVLDAAMLRRLLLGQVSEIERSHLEEAFFTSVDAFDRLIAIEEELADDYVSGTLSPTDRQAFETHFAVTPAGRRRLRSARAFHDALEELARHSLDDDQTSGRRRVRSRLTALVIVIAIAIAAIAIGIDRRRTTRQEAQWQAERASFVQQQDTLRREVDALRGRTAQIADSRADFSCTQGLNNWYYGYYGAPFQSGNFRLMTRCVEDRYYGPGSSWWVDPARYWTSMGAAVWFPNGPKSCGRQPVEHWPVRRWISEVEGTVTASGTVRNLLGEFDGFTARIRVDGHDMWSFTVPPGSSVTPPIPFRATLGVTRGAAVDFAIQPRWSDCNDHAEFLITITSDVPLRPGVPPSP
jgi:hypothetical protein